MRGFPNYLLTFKSDIHKGTTEQDWCLSIRKFFQGAFYKKNLMNLSRLPPRGDILPQELSGMALNMLACYRGLHISILGPSVIHH